MNQDIQEDIESKPTQKIGPGLSILFITIMSVTFHILDALSRDQYIEVTRETEDEQEVEYTWDSDPDISYGKHDGSRKQCSMIIHLFGMTDDAIET